MGRIENEQIRTTHGCNLIGQMAFDVRLKNINTIDESYNTQTLNKLQQWTSKRSDIATLESNETSMVQTDKEIHSGQDDGSGDRNIIDYIEEEYDNTVGYFKDWDGDK